MWALLGKLLGGVIGGVGRILPDRDRQNEAQSRINEAEVSGAPSSRLRLWRSFLGWILTLLFAWEVAGRLIGDPPALSGLGAEACRPRRWIRSWPCCWACWVWGC